MADSVSLGALAVQLLHCNKAGSSLGRTAVTSNLNSVVESVGHSPEAVPEPRRRAGPLGAHKTGGPTHGP